MGEKRRGRSLQSSVILVGSVMPNTARMINSILIVCATVRMRMVGPGCDEVGVLGDRLAVKRRQHQLAHAHVALLIEQQSRRRSRCRRHPLSRFAHVVLVRLPLERLLDQDTVCDAEELCGERVTSGTLAVAAAYGEPRLSWSDDTEPGFEEARQAGA